MKANELMIGDFVCNANRFAKVHDIDKVIGVEFIDGGYDVFNPEEITPIPLTPEILEKNGFKFDGMADWKLEGKDGLFIKVCPVQPNNDDWWHPSSTGFEVNNSISDILLEGVGQVYVHQFQHALTMANIEINLIL